jgi:ferredoxin
MKEMESQTMKDKETSLPSASAPPLQPPFEKAKFDGLVLVCGECQKRSSGPSKLTAKDVRKELKNTLGKDRFRMRVAQSSCLGLCPKKAIAVAAAATDVPSLMASVRNEGDVALVAARLAGSA